jgi:hypothetical protein
MIGQRDGDLQAVHRQPVGRRFAALMIQSFPADPVRMPLPPAVRLPLSRV